jgi:hypothetical protein
MTAHGRRLAHSRGILADLAAERLRALRRWFQQRWNETAAPDGSADLERAAAAPQVRPAQGNKRAAKPYRRPAAAPAFGRFAPYFERP